jgi:putative nucleotidyltransferase with HDIG domain
MTVDPSGRAMPTDAQPSFGREVVELFRAAERLVETGAEDPESEAFLAEVVSDLSTHAGSDRVILSIVDRASGTLIAKALHGFGEVPPRELSDVGDGIQGWVMKTGKPLALPVGTESGGLPLLPFERGILLAAPIRAGSQCLGAVTLLRPRRAPPFGEPEIPFVTIVCSLLGGLIGHTRAEAEGRNAIRKTIESLTVALDARDSYTRGHSQRVAMFSLAIANELETEERWSFGEEMRRSLLMSALLHDIGKIGIRDEVLFKPGKLTDEEYELIKSHPEKGAEIVRMIPGFDDNVIAGILQHHERWDGRGYPVGLVGDRIHPFGRIIGLADAFDAIVTSRPYQTGASFGYAMGRVEELSGIAFDPGIVRAMMRALKDQQVWNELGSISSVSPVSSSERAEPEPEDDSDRTLRRIFGRNIDELPTLPHVVSQVLEKTRNENSRLDEIVDLISTDQALVSTYLKLVNSAFYGFNRRITTLKQAITLLGFRSVRNVVVNAGVVGIFRRRTFNAHYRRRLWNHSVACAVAARLLAEREGYAAREEAFTAGLLHDIGKVVIDQYAPKDSAAIMERVEAGTEPRAAECEVLGLDHTRVGAWIAERWHLPRALCAVIEHHHDPERADGSAELVRIVGAANAICRIRPSGEDDDVTRSVDWFVSSPDNHLDLAPAATRSLLDVIWQRKADAMKTFGDVVAPEPPLVRS